MSHDHSDAHSNGEGQDRLRKISRYVFFGFVAVAAYFLITEHRAHVIPFLPFLLLAACPLMHIFMHRGHGHGSHDDEESSSGAKRPPSSGSGGGAHQH